MLHPECNSGKKETLGALYDEYLSYLRSSVSLIVSQRVFYPDTSVKEEFFPRSKILSSQIEKNAKKQARSIVSAWLDSLYARKLKWYIKDFCKENNLSESFKKELYTIGKYQIQEPTSSISQEAIDLYVSWVFDPEISGNPPSISNKCSMLLSQDTGIFGDPEKAFFPAFWIRISTLTNGKRIELPISQNQYIKRALDASKGISVRRDRKGRWRFEALDKIWENKYEVTDASSDRRKALVEARRPTLTPAPGARRIGIDVGLNVIAATSEGDLFGGDFKKKFLEKKKKIDSLRERRQKEGLLENSRRLDVLEDNLSGFTKSVIGNISSRLVKAYPNAVFVMEDLNLSGTKGSKRFGYRALARAMALKAPLLGVNCAYTSQPCPYCGYIHRGNRQGTKFRCLSCGKTCHADTAGGKNIKRRSLMGDIDLSTSVSDVRKKLRKLYWDRRNPSQDCPLSFLEERAKPFSRRRKASQSAKAPQGVRKSDRPDDSKLFPNDQI
jgi:hypothetical protein